MLTDDMLRFNVSLYGNTEQITPTISKCRVRIFYKGLNRNRTFISEDFAQQLIDSLPYAPVKGIFDKDSMDYKDHGEHNTDGQIYGLVAADPNFAWEKHLDEDGVEREYACADVILYTALYPEANLIFSKPQSMEIHRNGLKGEWKIWEKDGQPYYHFLKGHLLGLQVLGNEVEPCFEGAAFFSLLEQIASYNLKNIKKEESIKMDKNLFRLSDSEKCELLWDAVNSTADSYTMICDIYDDYAIAYDCVNKQYKRVYYTKNDTNITVDKTEDCYIVDVNAVEKSALDALRSMGSFSEIKERLDSSAQTIETYEASAAEMQSKIEGLTAEIETYKNATPASDGEPDGKDNSEFEAKIQEYETKIQEYETKIQEKDSEIVRLNQLNSDILNEKSELESFKNNIDTEKKTAILDEFSANLTETQIEDFKNKMLQFSVEDFKKEVCIVAYESNPNGFNSKDTNNDLIYLGNNNYDTGVMRLLRQHKDNKGGNK